MSLSFPASPTVGQTYQSWIWNGSSWDANVAAQFVTSINGKSGSLTSADVAALGTRVPITSQVVSTPVASVAFTGLSAAYDIYEVDIIDFTPAADDNMILRVSTDNGATWDNTARYVWGYAFIAVSSTTSVFTGSGIGAVAQAIVGGQNTSATPNMSTRLQFFRLSKTDGSRKQFLFQQPTLHPTSGDIYNYGGGAYLPIVGVVVNGIRFSNLNAGNITRGTFNLYGIKK